MKGGKTCLFFFYLAPNVAPSEVGGGGGSNRELTITWVVSIIAKLHMFYSFMEELYKG